MNQSAKAQEPSMEEILASIRRIIADDDARAPAAKAPEPPPPPPPPKPAPPKAAPPPPPPKPAAPPPKPAAPPPKAAAPAPAPAAAEGAAMSQDDIDAMLAGFDSPAAPPPVARAPEPEPEPEPEPPAPANDILDLTESMAAAAEPLPPPPPPASAPTNFRTIDGHSDVVFSEPRSRPEAPERPLLSSTTSAAVDSAFNALAQTVLVQNARTLEDLVKEMLRPMLKSWLDDNLPSLVERIVKAEIERVSRGRNGG